MLGSGDAESANCCLPWILGETQVAISEEQLNNDARDFARFLEGDERGFRALFKRYQQRMYVYCLKILGNQQQAEDVTQEMWERVIQLRAAPQPVRNPGGLLLRVARNLCIDQIRARKPLVPIDDANESHLLAQTEREPSELEELVLTMLDRLSFEYREVLILNLYCGYRFDEIAAMTGKTPDAIWARASRARAQLRKMVAATLGPATPESTRETPNIQQRNRARTEDSN